MGRVALCFFGLTKDLSHVRENLSEYIFTPLMKQGFTYDLYGHSYHLSIQTNKRNGEKELPINPYSLTQLPNITVRYSTTEEADQYNPFSFYLQNGNGWSTEEDPNTIMLYYIRQLYSLNELTKLWTTVNKHYDYVIYLRPDVRFTTPLTLEELPEDTIATPNFHRFKGYNDRFAYGSSKAMALYGSRLLYLPLYFQKCKKPLHAETYLRTFFTLQGLSNRFVPIHFIRVRANGLEVERDIATASLFPNSTRYQEGLRIREEEARIRGIAEPVPEEKDLAREAREAKRKEDLVVEAREAKRREDLSREAKRREDLAREAREAREAKRREDLSRETKRKEELRKKKEKKPVPPVKPVNKAPHKKPSQNNKKAKNPKGKARS